MTTEIENPNIRALLSQIKGLVERLSKCEVELEKSHADGAVMRGVLEEIREDLNGIGRIKEALSTSCGADLLSRYREAVKALQFYADEKNWIDQNFPHGDYLSLALVDKGEEARTLLAKVKGEVES